MSVSVHPIADTRVLIVEDEPFMMSLLKRMLKKIGIEQTTEAVDGSDALIKLEGAEVDLIISDVMMLPMNGLQLLKSVRSGMSAANSKTPFVVFTGSGESSVFGTALALDCDGFVSKSGDPEDLLRRVTSLFTDERQVEEAASYHTVPVPEIVNDAVPIEVVEVDAPEDSICIMVHQVEFGDVLDRDFRTVDGHLLFDEGTVLTDARLSRLADIAKLIELPQMWIKRG